MDVTNSSSDSTLTVTWRDKNGAPTTPTSATYTVKCLTTGTVVRPATPFPSLGPSVDLVLTALKDNAMVNASNTIERKKVTTSALFANGEAASADFLYALRNVA